MMQENSLGRSMAHPLTGSVAPALIVAVFAAAFMTPGLLGNYEVEIAYRLMLYICLAEAWNLLAGYGGLVSLGSAAFVGVGAYAFTSALNAFGVPPIVGLLLAGLAGGVFAVLVSPAVFRMRGLYFTVGTLALGEALRLFMVNVPWFGGSRGLFLDADFPSREALFWWALGLLALSQFLITVYTRTRLSIILRSVRDDEDAAAQLGVRIYRVKLVAFVVASMLMGMGGGLQAYKLGAVEPYGMFGLPWSIDILSMVVIGGLGLRYGALVGAFFVITLAELLADYPEAHIVVTGLVLALVVRFAPRGVCGLVIDNWKRRRSETRGSEREVQP
ncbi:branched-chain amino acid ABC transporter permease [Roseibium litorale]|uniref:Branched-chain amino acid ABC transporter permease n=1 Tax=Roseibium litorale TaxID=2803841 RepID=A0ABR9CSZ1_9HYPH|nr:branched-chain amino acid ABC transporter permease [Roseibium litorale]MBD8893396.1 branched-chain amino acid ABC transporter permease [Roseibium litorale]